MTLESALQLISSPFKLNKMLGQENTQLCCGSPVLTVRNWGLEGREGFFLLLFRVPAGPNTSCHGGDVRCGLNFPSGQLTFPATAGLLLCLEWSDVSVQPNSGKQSVSLEQLRCRSDVISSVLDSAEGASGSGSRRRRVVFCMTRAGSSLLGWR